MNETANKAAPPKRPRRLGVKLGAATVAVLLAFSCAELAVRILHPGEPGQLANTASDDVTTGKRLKPGPQENAPKVTINALGFRDDEDFPEAKPAGETRVLFVGDSFLFGAFLDVSELVTKRTEARLRLAVKPLRAIDLGCPGWGTHHEKFAFRNFGAPTQPDVVVLCFFVGNDVCETFQSEHSASESDEHDVVSLGSDHELVVEKRRTRLHMRVLRCSKLFRLWEASALYQRLVHRKSEKPSQGAAPTTLREDAYWKIELLRMEQWRRGQWEKPVLQEAWDLVAKNLGELVQEVRARGAKPAILVIPDEVQVDAKKRAFLCQRFALDEKDYDLEQPQRRVAELAAALQVPCVDVLPAFREKGAQGGLYFDLDTHWNAKGHDLAAELLAPVVEKLLR